MYNMYNMHNIYIYIIYIHIYIYIYIYIYIGFFLLRGWGGSAPPSHQSKICPILTAFPPNFYSLPTKSKFNQIKTITTSFLAVVIAPVPVLF